MIEKLTVEQEVKLKATRDRFFEMGIAIVTDRSKAESAVAVIVAPSLSKYEVHWVQNPEDGASLRDSLLASLRDSLLDSLLDSLRDSLRASQRASLRDSLLDSLRDSLLASLRASLLALQRASQRASLLDSLLEVPFDCGLIAFYDFGARLVPPGDAERARLDAMIGFMESAFALWVLPGHVIILGKPSSVVVEDGRLIDATWG